MKKELRLDIVDVPVQVGDYVLNHVGYAIRRIPPEEVGETLALFDQMLREAAGRRPHGRGRARRDGRREGARRTGRASRGWRRPLPTS